MKKLILILALCIFFCSCHQEYNILTYQEGNIEANLTINDKYTVNLTKTNDFLQLYVLSPSYLEGICFEISNDKSYAIKDEIKIPLDKNKLKGICAILNCFSLSEETITTVSTDNVISFDTDYGLYTVTYGENNLPQIIAIAGQDYQYSIIVNTIRLCSAKG